jgi:hypothetical protein
MESAVVVAVYQFGIPIAVLFAGGCLLALRSVTRRTSPVLTISALTFVGVGLSNDALVGKTPLWIFALVLLAAAASVMSRRESAARGGEAAWAGPKTSGGARWTQAAPDGPPLGWSGAGPHR